MPRPGPRRRWLAAARFTDEPVRYDGVRILELDGNRVIRFRAFRPASPGRQLQRPERR